YINAVNASRKSKSAKKPVNRKVWKTTGKVFKTVGYQWKPTGRNFMLVGNVCPLTRIATATIVPPREPIPIITKSEKTSVATSPSSNIDSNTPVLSSTGVALVSSASGSKSQDNTKKNRIRRTQKKAKETKLEDHLRNVNSSLNKASVVDTRATSSVIKSVSNVNSNLKCAFCNGCLFSDNHDACVVEYIKFCKCK
nr:hypothetical protein [Tanacetum cinerariifolium]